MDIPIGSAVVLDINPKGNLIYYFSVIPAQAGIQSLAEPIGLDSGSPLRFGRNDE
jgi:hypothetical protein